MRRECREPFPRHRIQRKPPVSDPDMHHGTCIAHVPWCMPGSLTRGGGENVPGNFMHLVRGPSQNDVVYISLITPRENGCTQTLKSQNVFHKEPSRVSCRIPFAFFEEIWPQYNKRAFSCILLYIVYILPSYTEPRQNGGHFADDIFKCISLNVNFRILTQISLKFVRKLPINNKPASV